MSIMGILRLPTWPSFQVIQICGRYCIAASIVPVMPSAFAQLPSWCGRADIKPTLTKMIIRPQSKQANATETAVFHVYWFSVRFCGSAGPLGKKTRSRKRLFGGSVSARTLSAFLGCNLHDGEAEPLYPDLCDTQKASNTLKGTDGLTAGHICSGNR